MKNQNNQIASLKKAIAVFGIVSLSAGFSTVSAQANFLNNSSSESTVNQPLQIAGSDSKEAKSEVMDIVAKASKSEKFNTLVAALDAADLVEVLQGEGPFTVFAPTDEAFAALPEGTLDQLLLEENKDKLVQILTYHVVPGKVMSETLESGAVATVEGSEVNITVSDAGVQVDDATVLKADVLASNGVIHVIDKVILPE